MNSIFRWINETTFRYSHTFNSPGSSFCMYSMCISMCVCNSIFPTSVHKIDATLGRFITEDPTKGRVLFVSWPLLGKAARNQPNRPVLNRHRMGTSLGAHQYTSQCSVECLKVVGVYWISESVFNFLSLYHLSNINTIFLGHALST